MMTTKAHIRDDWERDMVGIAVVRDQGQHGSQVLQWAPVAVETREPIAGYRVETEEDRLYVREEDARAIYEALADHFGHGGHDARSLRRDYDDERGRVDKLIAHLTGGQR